MAAPREKQFRYIRRRRIKIRIRKRIFGTPDRPRLTVYRSLQHIYAQIIDDTKGHTLVAASSLERAIREKPGTKTEKAYLVGQLLAQRALAKGIQKVAFDRNGYKYHGRVKALAEGARAGKLDF